MCSDSTSITRPPLGHVVVPRHDLALELLARSPRRRRSSRLDSVSSGPNSRKFSGLSLITSRSQAPSTRVASEVVAPGAGTSTAYSRKSGSRRSRRSRPPLACGFALIRRSPPGASAASSGTRRAVGVEQFLGVVGAQPLLAAGPGAPGSAGPRPAGPGAPARCPPPAGRPPPWARSSPWGCAARSSARRAGVRSPSTRARCWMARISARTVSMVAASCWCTSLGSSPSTMYGVYP